MMNKMRRVSEITAGQSIFLNKENYDCPFCGREQVIQPVRASFGSFKVLCRQCLSCAHVSLETQVSYYFNGVLKSEISRLYPLGVARPAVSFTYVPGEISAAYGEACGLVAHHIGAAGAYARRALELILDHAGYQKATLAASIEAAGKEQDAEKRLPRRLLTKLDYVKEIGNFALHVRRDGELAIVDIDIDEVEACLETIEELVTFLFEEPGRDRARTIALNEKLKAAGKKEINLPPELIVPMIGDVLVEQKSLPAPEEPTK